MITRQELQTVSDRYRAERPIYQQFVNIARDIAEKSCRDRGVKCAVSGRAKEYDSFVKKMMKYPQPYEEVYDKAGVRIVPVYPDDRSKLVELVNEVFVVSWQRDFDDAYKPDQFGYRGYHFTVALRDVDKGTHPADVTALAAELQIHTPGAHVWADVNHDLFYKTWMDIDVPTTRAINRLSAILELVDMSMGDLRRAILAGPGADLAKTMETIEKDHMRLSGQPFDASLTRAVVRSLAPMVGPFDAFVAAYQRFVADKAEKLTFVRRYFEDDVRDVLLSQPESLLIFYFLEQHMGPELERHWPETVPSEILNRMAEMWVA